VCVFCKAEGWGWGGGLCIGGIVLNGDVKFA